MTGIWMWPEVFTHNFESGENVTIILLEVRGNRNDLTDFKSLYTLSMMSSSVQCYATMDNIEETDFYHLELLDKLVFDDPKKIPLQRFLFIVRNWIDRFDIGYGLQGQNIFNDVVDASINKSSGIQALQNHLNAKFADVNVFFMPYPNGNKRITNLTQENMSTNSIQGTLDDDAQSIDTRFREFAKELVSSLFAPRNLKMKLFTGQKVRARDFVEFLHIFATTFDGGNSLEEKRVQKVGLYVFVH